MSANDNAPPHVLPCAQCDNSFGTRALVGDIPRGVTMEAMAEKLARFRGWRTLGGKWLCPTHATGKIKEA